MERQIVRTVEAEKQLVRKWLREIPDCVLTENLPLRSVQRQLFRDVEALCDSWRSLDLVGRHTKLGQIILVSRAHSPLIQEIIASELSRRRILSKGTFFKLMKTKGGF